jgi:FMN-dependent NADH-azoreductase
MKGAMTSVLFLTSSPRGQDSYSNRAATRLIEEIKGERPSVKIVHRDLAADPLPHIDGDFVTATRGPNGPQTTAQRDGAARSDVLVDELLAADTVVISAGMINFGIPSTLKAWIDHVARPGRTFSYASGAPEGLVKGKKVILVVATGGDYSGAGAPMDFQVPYLRHVLGFLGMTDVEVFTVAGTAYGPEAAEKAVAATGERIHQRCTEVASAA